jgi:hypothetical protein
LNRYPELKEFLKGGEAESYEGITVKFVHGKTAILTIYQDGQEQEKIVMHELKTRPAMHDMLRAKGFQRKPNQEVEKILTERKAEADRATEAALKKRAEMEERKFLRAQNDGRVANESRRAQSLEARHSFLTELRSSKRDRHAIPGTALQLAQEEQLLALVSPRYSAYMAVVIAGAMAVVGCTIVSMSRKKRKRSGGGSLRS